MDNPFEALNALLEERARYERWLEQLEERRAQTPAHVFERVRKDYSGRLDGVMVQLRSREAELEGSVAALEERLAGLLSEETNRRDSRAEIELRALVGEYSEERAQGELATCDGEIARLEGERTSVESELSRIQEILGLVRQPAQQTSPSPPALESRPTTDPGAFDELAFLQSVVDEPSAPLAAAAPLADAPSPVAGVSPSGARSGSQPAIRQAVPRATPATPSSTPAFLKDMPTEQVKTLKCQECGTMNYPTEWYCERCGGELAAM